MLSNRLIVFLLGLLLGWRIVPAVQSRMAAK